MTIELLYTSAAQGLKQGSRGFCTVVCTAGLPINLAQRLESLSGYRHLYQPGDARADENPVCHSHIRLVVGGKTLSIVSRVAAYGVDYSQRTNKIAHHVVFDGSVPSCGPAAVLSQSTVMRATWDGECKTLASGPIVPPLTLQPAPCQHWQRMAGDAGWAGVVANAWLQPTGKPVWIIFSESQSKSLLLMMQEATALLPESRRWQATFSTYCTNLPPDVECRVRCVVAGSDEARMSIARGVVLDLTKPLGEAPDSEASDAARNGFAIGTKTTSIPAVAPVPDKYEEPEDDFESAFAEGTSEEEDYSLQPRLPSVAPILLKSPKIRGKQKTKRVVAEPQSGFFTNRTLILAAAGLAILLSLLGGFAIWFATSNNVAGIVGSEPAPREEKTQLPKSPADTGRPGQKNDQEKDNIKARPPAPILPTKSIPEISISQRIEEIEENKDIDPESAVASLTIDNFDPMEFKVSIDSTHFRYQDKKIFFKTPPAPYDFETTPKLEGVIKVEAKDLKVVAQKSFTVKVKDLVENTLEFNISVDDGQPKPTSVFEGTKLVATIKQGSIDLNERVPFERAFVWKGRNGANAWTEISNSGDIVISSDFSEVCCELQYSHKSQSPNTVTTVQSEPIKINPTGKAEVSFNSILSRKDLELSIEVSFPELIIPGKNKYPFLWAKHGNYLSGNTLNVLHQISFLAQDRNEFKLSTDDLKFVSSADLSRLQLLIIKVRQQSEVIRQRVDKLKSAANILKTMTDNNRVRLAFLAFVNQAEVKSTDKAFESVEAVDAWLTKAVALRKTRAEIKDNEKDGKIEDSDIEPKRQHKQNELKDLVSGYATVFANAQALPTNEAESEIVDFVEYFELGPGPPFNQNTKLKNQARVCLRELVDSIHSFRDSMRLLSDIDFLLENTEEIKVWPAVNSSKESGLAKIKSPENISFTSMFRLKTTVRFDEFNFGKNQNTKKSSSSPKQETKPPRIIPPRFSDAETK